MKADILSTECDFAAIHNLLSHAVRKVIPFPTERIISLADRLFNGLPVKQLISYSSSELRALIRINR